MRKTVATLGLPPQHADLMDLVHTKHTFLQLPGHALDPTSHLYTEDLYPFPLGLLIVLDPGP